MQYIKISSLGLLDSKGISLIGASTKRGDGASIGKFGSGFSYSIASMLNQDVEFKIFTGMREIKITTKPVKFRDTDFKQIYVDGKETSLTTTMGHTDWAGAWPYMRELYSNALDEDKDAVLDLVNEMDPTEFYTSIYIKATEELIAFYKDKDNYFNTDDSRVLSHTDKAKLLPSTENLRIFRKGIVALKGDEEKSLFNYDLDNIEVNESRQLKYSFQADHQISIFWENCTSKDLLNQWLTGMSGGNTGLREHKCILEEWRAKKASPEFLEVINSHRYIAVEHLGLSEDDETVDRMQLPKALIMRFLAYIPNLDVWGITAFKGGSMYAEIKPNADLAGVVSDAVGILMDTAYSSRLEAPIVYAKFEATTTLGFSDLIGQRIILSNKLVDYSPAEIAKIIIEEQEHLITEFSDKTREFQNHLFNLYFNSLTRKSHE